MERIGSELFPVTFSNGDTLSPSIGNCKYTQSPNLSGLTITRSSCHSTLPQNRLDLSGTMDYETLKVFPSYNKSVPTSKKAGNLTTKRGVHKVIERQRRKEMKELYHLLRTLLPGEYIMGKRSTAEQLLQTSNYIKDLQKKVKELTQKRDEMTQKRDEMRKGKICKVLHLSVPSEIFPAVRIHSLGADVLVSINTLESQIVLSDLLLTLENNEHAVVSVSSSAMNGKVFHTIQAKVSDLDSFESRILYQKIWDLVRENSLIADAVPS